MNKPDEKKIEVVHVTGDDRDHHRVELPDPSGIPSMAATIRVLSKEDADELIARFTEELNGALEARAEERKKAEAEKKAAEAKAAKK